MSQIKEIVKETIKSSLTKFYSSKKETMDLLMTINEISEHLNKLYEDDRISSLLNEISQELIGLSTELHSQKEKIVQNSTMRVVTEYMLSYLDSIEREIINSSRSKMKLYQKIKKMINEYLTTNYFKKIMVITMVDDIIESVYGDEYTLSKFIFELVQTLASDKDELKKFLMIYQNIIDTSDLPDLKISYRKAIIERNYTNDLLCDVWKKLEEFVGKEETGKILNSLSFFKSKKMAYNKDVLNPIIYALKDSEYNITDEYKKIELNGKIYYGASIFTLEDNNTKFERFISKLKNFNYFAEADLLYTYLVNNINLLTDKIIQEKFSKINNELYEELISLNENKFTQTCIGHIILSNPSENMFDKQGNLSFIFSMVMKSIFKMSEILLINDFEFQEFQKEMLVTLQQISKLRDIETAKHQDRVTIYTQILAEALHQKKESGELTNLISKNKITLDTDYHIVDDEYIRDLLYSASYTISEKLELMTIFLRTPKIE